MKRNIIINIFFNTSNGKEKKTVKFLLAVAIASIPFAIACRILISPNNIIQDIFEKVPALVYSTTEMLIQLQRC